MARWIKWWTTAEQNQILNDGKPFDRYHAFMWLVESAAPKPTTRKGVAIKRGQVWTTLAFMRDTWHWGSIKRVSKFLDELEADNMIRQTRTRQGTLLTVEKYTTFQDQGNTEIHKRNTKETSQSIENSTISQHSGNTKETKSVCINKKKEEKKNKNPSGFSSSGQIDPRYGVMKEGEADVL